MVSKNQVEEIDKAMLRSIVFRQPYSPAGPKQKGNMKKEDTITLKIDGANTGQLQALCIDLALSLKPWDRYVKIKILKGKKSFKLQAPRVSLIDFVKNKKQQAAGSKLDNTAHMG